MFNITIMNTRLKQFLAAENISQSQFADTINVVRASVSHVLSGRNYPSYEFIKAIMACYPHLNMDWLMLGKGKMYRDQSVEISRPSTPEPVIGSDLLFSEYDIEDTESTSRESIIPDDLPAVEQKTQFLTDINTLKEAMQPFVKQRNVAKIIIMFDDGTFQEM